VLGAASLAALLASLVLTPLPGLVLVGLGSEIVVRVVDNGFSPVAAILYAAGLLLLCELVAWADALRGSARVAGRAVASRLAHLFAAVVVGAAAAALTVAAGGVESPNAFVAGVAGAAAVTAIAMLVWSLGRRAA
jgi:hypothetical protein